jgi:hypothetical protein
MNVDNMRETLEAVRLNEKFNMRVPYSACGSPACVMGTAGIRAGMSSMDYLQGTEEKYEKWRDKICQWLDINPYEFHYIFQGYFSEGPMEEITHQEAISYLEKCVAAGKVITTQSVGDN